MNFASDNVVGASRPVLDALIAANEGPRASYGNDDETRAVEARLSEIFEREVAVSLVATGTAANALALCAFVPPYGAILCHANAHVMEDECGAPEFFAGGAKLIGLDGVGAKIAPQTLARALAAYPAPTRQSPPFALSISQASECGLVYRPAEIAALAEVARGAGLALHMDGARFANALVALGCSPAEMTWKAGIDVLSFGATKNGCLAAEAVIVFDPARAKVLPILRKRAGHTLSKGRLLGAQLLGYLGDDHWLANARHANAMAARLADGLGRLPGVRLAWPAEANEVFPVLPLPVAERLRAQGAIFHPWAPTALPEGFALNAGEGVFRLVTSFATREADVEFFLERAAEAFSASA